MYPANFFELFPPFTRDNRCFVAMSFDDRFLARWTEVIAPAVRATRAAFPDLVPHRIDLGRRGDSILAEILDEVARCRLIIADISTVATVAGRALRNANVLYELGLAHACRLPEEVIVLRSDGDPLPFDVTNVRVHSYCPDDDPAHARGLVEDLITNALLSVEYTRSQAVKRTAEILDFESWDALYAIASDGPIGHPGRTDVVEQKIGVLQALARIAGIQRLLELGAISTQLQTITTDHVGGYSRLPRQDLFKYVMTPFGEALLQFCLQRMDYFSPEISAEFAAVRDRDAAL